MKYLKSIKIVGLFFVAIVIIQMLISDAGSIYLQETMDALFKSVLLALVVLKYKISRKEIGLTKFNRNDSSFVIMFISLFTLSYLFFSHIDWISYTVGSSVKPADIIFFYTLVPVGLLVSAVLEEVVFTKLILLEQLKNENPLRKILFVAVLFTLVHVPSSWFHFVFLMVGSIIFSYVALVTNTIRYTVFLHFLSNFLILFYVLFDNSDPLNQISWLQLTYNHSFWSIEAGGLLSLIATLIFFVYFITSFRKKLELQQ
ncbi:MAG: CPBP family intramembrane glutamic endopeptidase [Cyclobacteriaceae bacterium]